MARGDSLAGYPRRRCWDAPEADIDSTIILIVDQVTEKLLVGSGLKAGEIVTAGQFKLVESAKVNVTNGNGSVFHYGAQGARSQASGS